MTDRELIEAAGRAVGQERSHAGDLWSDPRGELWNPLTDDGDALRLAVKLKMGLHYETQTWPSDADHRVFVDKHFVEAYSGHRPDGFCHCSAFDYEDEAGRLAATRRAIVHAAASLAAETPGAPSHELTKE